MTKSELARAKVNLALHVVGRRADGYHLLDMLVVFPGIGDRLTAEPSQTLSFHVTGPFAPALSDTPAEDNLVLRAARGLRRLAPEAGGATITLEKNLPVASGIGGGSADAAAAMRFLSRLWGLDWKHPDVLALARSLGADVPMCLTETACRAEGIGQDLTPWGILPRFGIVLANPRVPVPTPEVFQRLERRDNPPLPAFWAEGERFLETLRATRNDLEAPARLFAPVIGDVLTALERTDGALIARMSGSGATCFALYQDADDARRAADALQRTRPDWWVAAGDVAGGS